MPSKKEPEEIGWLCAKCDLPLELAAVKLTYLDETFVVDLPACPSCQRVLVSEENAVGKMALAEQMLEDK
ncbi:DNA-binding protein [Geobacter hydrogenophilus]|nr:DNA-binding protein [Geobacter hydrogenophilus]